MAEHLHGGSSIRLTNGFLPDRMKPSNPTPQRRPISPLPSWKLYQNPFYDGLLSHNALYSRSGAHLARSDPSSSRIHFDPAVIMSACKLTPPSRGEQPENHLIHTQNGKAPHLREDAIRAPSDLAGVKAQPSSTVPTVSESMKCTSVLPSYKCPEIGIASHRSVGMPETEELQKAIATTPDASCDFKETLERASSVVEDSHPVSMSSLFSALHVELENASTRLQQLELSQKSVLSEIDGLLKKIGEELTMSRRAEQDSIIQEALEHLREKKGEEKSTSNSLSKMEDEDLSKRVSEAYVRAAASVFARQDMKRGLMAEVWNGLVKGIEEEKISLEEPKQEQAKLRDERREAEAEEEREMSPTGEEVLREEVEKRLSETHQLELENKGMVSLEDLKSKMEDFVETTRRCGQGQYQKEQPEMVRKALELLQEGNGSVYSNVEPSAESDTEKIVDSSVLFQRLGELNHESQVELYARRKEVQGSGKEGMRDAECTEANEWKENVSNDRKHSEDHVLSSSASRQVIGNNDTEKKRHLQASAFPIDIASAAQHLHPHTSSPGEFRSAWQLGIAPAAHHLHPHTASNEASSSAGFHSLRAPAQLLPRGESPSKTSSSAWHVNPSPPAHPLPYLAGSHVYQSSNSTVWQSRTGKVKNQDQQPTISTTPRHQHLAGSSLYAAAAYLHGLSPDAEWKKLLFEDGKHPADLQSDDLKSSVSNCQTRSEPMEKRAQLQPYSAHYDHRLVDPTSAHHHQHPSQWKESDSKHSSMDRTSADHDYSVANSHWHSSSSEGLKDMLLGLKDMPEASSSHHPAGSGIGAAPPFLRHRPDKGGEEFLSTHRQHNAFHKTAGQTSAHSAWRTKRSEVDEHCQRLPTFGHQSLSFRNPPPADRLMYPESRWKDFSRHPGGSLQLPNHRRADTEWRNRPGQDSSLRHSSAYYPHNGENLYRAPHSEWHSCCEMKNQHEVQPSPRSRLNYTGRAVHIIPDPVHYPRLNIGNTSFATPNSACNASSKEGLDCTSPGRLRQHSTGRFSDRSPAHYRYCHSATARTPEPEIKTNTQQYGIVSPELFDHGHLLHQQRIPLLKMPQALPTPEVGDRPTQCLWPVSPPPDSNSTFTNGLRAEPRRYSDRSSMHAQLLEGSRQKSYGMEKSGARALRFSSFRRSGRTH